MSEETTLKKPSTAKKLIVLAVCCAAIVAITFFGGRFLSLVGAIWIRRVLNCVVYAAMAVCALIAMKLSGVSIKKQLDFGSPKQYLWGLAVFAVLSLGFAVIPILCGQSIIGGHYEAPVGDIIYEGVFYIIFVGPVEELVFRGYMQELLADILPKQKWLSAVTAAALFGLWHLVNGSLIQVLFTFAIGLIFGLSKYFIKNCTLISVSLGHGLYDFMNIIWRMILIR